MQLLNNTVFNMSLVLRFSKKGFKRRTTLIPHSSLELPEPPESSVSRLRSPSPLPPSLSIVFERLRSSPQLSVLLPTWWVFFCQLQLLCGWTAKHDSWGLRRPCGGTPRGPRDVDMAVKFSFAISGTGWCTGSLSDGNSRGDLCRCWFKCTHKALPQLLQ